MIGLFKLKWKEPKFEQYNIRPVAYGQFRFFSSLGLLKTVYFVIAIMIFVGVTLMGLWVLVKLSMILESEKLYPEKFAFNYFTSLKVFRGPCRFICHPLMTEGRRIFRNPIVELCTFQHLKPKDRFPTVYLCPSRKDLLSLVSS